MRRLAIIAIVLGALFGASSAQAKGHTVHLTATDHTQVYRTPVKLSGSRALAFSVYVNGHEVDASHSLTDGVCKAAFVSRSLAAQVRSCGARSPLVIEYIGSARFTLVWALR